MASTLDTAKLAKVRALMDRGATEGERAAARKKAEGIARAAGLTLDAALSKLDDEPTATKTMADAFNDLFNSPEMRQRRAKRERERAIRRDVVLRRYGSEEAVFAETERERLLRTTLEPLADRKPFSNSPELYISGYAGWTCCKPPPRLWEAIEAAFPLPTSLAAVWAELCWWEALRSDRCAFDGELFGYDTPVWVRAREAALESLMDTMPAPTFEGVRTRIFWMQHLNQRGYSRDVEEDEALVAALRADIDGISASVYSGHRTTVDKRGAVLRMLEAQPGLSDREIARRLSVSPQTVNTWRKKMRAKEAS